MSIFLDRKYVGLVSPRLDKFSRKRDNLYNFRCPYCGDSKKNPNKTRGFFYAVKNDLYFKCHNCERGRTLYNFLKDWDSSLCSEYAMERFRNGENGHSNFPKKNLRESEKIEYSARKNSDLLLGLDAICDLQSEHYAKSYLLKRQIPDWYFSILYFVPDFKLFVDKAEPENEYNLKPNDPRIVIPFFDSRGEIIAIQGRALMDNKLRYITIKLKKNAPKIFGLDRLKPEGPIYILEGPFDAMCLYPLENVVAMAGSDVDIPFDKDRVVLIMDCEPRNKQVCEKMEKAHLAGYKVMVWPASWEFKDINDAIIAGYSQERIVQIIQENVLEGLKFQLKYNEWLRC